MSDKTWRRAVLVLVLLGGACGIAIMTWVTVAAVQFVSVAEECAGQANEDLDDYDTNDEASRLIGQTEAQLDDELGAPTQTNVDGWARTYRIRPLGFCMDNLWLFVQLDGTGIVIDARVAPR